MDTEIDCRGMRCPMPIVELAKAIKGLESGSTVVLLSDDPATASDLAAWSRMTGNSVTEIATHTYRIAKK
jgi:tRNA 2-thiouridine synthesizing protein A